MSFLDKLTSTASRVGQQAGQSAQNLSRSVAGGSSGIAQNFSLEKESVCTEMAAMTGAVQGQHMPALSSSF